MAEPGSPLPGGFVLGPLNHADRVGLVYDARGSDGRLASAHVLHPLHVDELREWFEATAAQGLSLRHPNLVEVFAAGETHNGLPAVVTERVDGRTLRARIAASDLPPGPELLRVVRAVAGALDYLHARTPPVLHRALMPEHVVTTPEGLVKLLAVGHAERPHHTPAKPPYLSPEELLGRPTSAASDVFSLASLTFELFMGRPAFPGDAGAVVSAVQRGALPCVGVVASDALGPLNRALHRAWSADPRDRFPRAGAFATELDEALRLVPSSLLAVRRATRDSSVPRSAPPSNHPLRASTRPPTGPMPTVLPSGRLLTPAMGRPLTPPMGRVLTPAPGAVSTVPRSVAAAYALPPPARVPTGLLAALESPQEAEAVIDLVTERARSVTPQPREPAVAPAAPPVDEMPARLRVDTDDAVLIMEPSLIEDRAVLDAIDDELPPPVSIEPPAPAADDDDDAPSVELFDEPARVQVIQKLVVFEPHATASTPPEEPAASAALATVDPSIPPPPRVPRVSPFNVSPTELARGDDPRPSWTRWRPRISSRPPPPRAWGEREIHFTPRVLAALIVGNVALTALIVWAVIALTRR